MHEGGAAWNLLAFRMNPEAPCFTPRASEHQPEHVSFTEHMLDTRKQVFPVGEAHADPSIAPTNAWNGMALYDSDDEECCLHFDDAATLKQYYSSIATNACCDDSDDEECWLHFDDAATLKQYYSSIATNACCDDSDDEECWLHFDDAATLKQYYSSIAV
jgi:hypothetical protein